MHSDDDSRYGPIREYAVIGDCHGAALVSRSGSIDWCCLGRFDADPVFCRMLDAAGGGYLSVAPESDYEVSREYLSGTNILVTEFETSEGVVRLTDFMPVGRAPNATAHDYVHLNAPRWIVRRAECVRGRVPLRIAYRPTSGFSLDPVSLSLAAGAVLASHGPALYSDVAFTVDGPAASGAVTLDAGQHATLVLSQVPLAKRPSKDLIDRLQGITRAFWWEWSEYCRYRGPYREHVLRSALTLKLLTYAPSGALVAATTSSLPEAIGGERNWDYRFCWIRDASFVLYALSALGYSGEAERFSHFLRTCCTVTEPRLQIMYGVEAETDLSEETFSNLEGYRGSRPVRRGNGAYTQQQLDVYGELFDWAHLYTALGGRINDDAQGLLRSLVEVVREQWHTAGEGIWEMRGPQRHHVYSKIMCWTAIDRALRMFGENDEWAALRDEIEASIRREGFDPGRGGLVHAYDHPCRDAAVLLAPEVGFPLEPEELEATVAGVEEALRRGDYLLRYDCEDGLGGEEGAFLICSFWLVLAKIHTGRIEEARAQFERILSCANDVGLYSEEIDPESGAFLGNFPQAFTHLALIQCAVNFDLVEQYGADRLRGAHADRAKHYVEAAKGWRALWAAFKRTGRVGRLFSSRASRLDESLYGD